MRPFAAVAGCEPRGERVTSRAAEAEQRTRASGGGESPGLYGAKRRKAGDTPGAGFRKPGARRLKGSAAHPEFRGWLK